MTGPDSVEVSAIQGCYLVHVESFGDRKDRSIDGSQWEVGVFSNQFGHS